MPVKRVFLIRHGETAWSLSGQHASITDVALTKNGRALARQLAPILAKAAFGRIFTSPMQGLRDLNGAKHWCTNSF